MRLSGVAESGYWSALFLALFFTVTQRPSETMMNGLGGAYSKRILPTDVENTGGDISLRAQ